MRPKLVLVAGKADKAEIRLKLPTIVGRTHDAGLMIAHKTVSRRHCELFERHGMLFVRDTGSRNGTLVDSAPIKKEAMVKPGHTLTIGPLTFRADYEPADSFIGADDPAPAPNGAALETGMAAGSATTAMPIVGEDSTRDFGGPEEGTTASITQTARPSDTPGELEFEEFSVDDLAELDMPAEVGSDLDDSADDAETDIAAVTPAPAAQAPAAAASAAVEEEISFDDDLGMEFNLDDLGGDDLGGAPAEAAAATDDDGILSLDIGEETPAVSAADAGDAVADFDLSEQPAPAGKKSADSLDDLLDDDLGFDIKDLGEPAAAEAESSEAGDDLGFTLEDLEESPAEFAADEAPAAEQAPAEETADDTLTFDLADGESPDADAAKPAKDAGSKLKLGDEKGPGGDSEMSRFMKELGL